MRYLAMISMLLVLAGCSQESTWDCIQSEGDKTVTEIALDGDFQRIKIKDDINLVLHNGLGQRVEIRTGENLVPEINFRLEDGQLTISNDNTCRWSRPSKNVEVHIYTDTLQHIEKRGYGDIWSEDVLDYSFRVLSYVPGLVDLELNTRWIGFELYALTNVELTGQVFSMGVYVNTAVDAIVRAEDLAVDIVTVTHDGFNSVHVSPTQELVYSIWNSGDIYLYQEPAVVTEMERTGTGEVIRNF